MGTLFQKWKNYLAGKSRFSDYIPLKIISEQRSDEDKQIFTEKEVEGLMEKAKEFSSNTDFLIKLLDLIDQIRLAVKEKCWIRVQHLLSEAISLINRAIGSEAMRFIRFGLLLSPLVWFIFFYYLQRLMEKLGDPGSLFRSISQEYFQYIWLGMIGGTTVVLWGIVKHSAEMDFDSTYIFWYLVKPALGAITGVAVVLVVQAVFVSLQGDLKINNTVPLLVFAYIGGFSERFIINLIDRAVTAIFGGGKSLKTQAMSVYSQSPPSQEISDKSEERD